MNILFCDYEYPPLGGGGGALNAWLAEELAAKHKVTVLTSGGKGLAADEMVNGVRVIRVPVYFRGRLQTANMPSMAAYVMNAILKGRKLVREEKFDIINTFFAIPSGPAGHYLSRFAKIPNVLSVLGGDIYDPSKKSSPHRHGILRRLVSYLLREADCVVGESRDVLENVNRYYIANMDNPLIPLGIPRPPKSEKARSDFHLGDNDFVMVTVGRLVTRKAVDQLIHIVSRMNQPNLKLVVLGGGPEEKRLSSLAESLQATDKVRFMGHVNDSDKLSLLNCADIYVSTSQHEGFGLVFLEGMAAGLPVVCYDNGGQTDFIADNENGYLIPLNQQGLFQDAIERLYTNPEIRQTISSANLKTIENYFIDSCAKEYEELYESCIKSATAG